MRCRPTRNIPATSTIPASHLLDLINEILDLSRIEAGRYELNEEPVSLTHVVEDCHHLLKLRAKNRGITIHEVFEPDLPRLWADERARAPDLPQPPVQRDQVHAAGRRDLAQGRLDRVRRPVHERQGHRPRHSRGGNPDRARLVRPGLELRSSRPSKAPASACRSPRAWSTCMAAPSR